MWIEQQYNLKTDYELKMSIARFDCNFGCNQSNLMFVVSNKRWKYEDSNDVNNMSKKVEIMQFYMQIEWIYDVFKI